MLSNNPLGTTVPIRAFGLSGRHGNSESTKTIAIIRKGWKSNQPAGGAVADIESLLRSLAKEYRYLEVWDALGSFAKTCTILASPQVAASLRRHDCVMVVFAGPSGRFTRILSQGGIQNIVYRAQNPEGFHRLSYFFTSGALRDLSSAIKGLVSDSRALRNSTTVLTISENDRRRYFQPLKKLVGGKASVESFGYYPDSTIVPTSPYAPFFLVGSSSPRTLTSSVDRRLASKVRRGKVSLTNFCGVGFGLESIERALLRNYGFQVNFDRYINRSPLVVIPTTKGWGFKTKIADFLSQGKSVVVHEKLAQRIDPEIRDRLIVLRDWTELNELTIPHRGQQLAAGYPPPPGLQFE